jgi:hypothetical protein
MNKDLSKIQIAAAVMGSLGGKKTASLLTAEEKSERGRKGGIAAAANMTPEERSARGKKARAAGLARKREIDNGNHT